MTIGNLTPGLDGYRYRCTVQDQCFLVQSDVATFTFNYLPPVANDVYITDSEGNAFYVLLDAWTRRGCR